MSLRIHVSTTIADARAEIKKRQFKNLGVSVSAVEIVDCYSTNAPLSQKQRAKALELLANKTIERSALILQPKLPFDYAIEIGYLPGVTDNVGTTARETLADGLPYKFKPDENVYSSQVFFVHLNKKNTEQPAEALAKKGLVAINKIADSLYNPLIQRATIKSFNEFSARGGSASGGKKSGLPITIPTVSLHGSKKVLEVNLNVTDEELAALGKLGIPEVVSSRKSGVHPTDYPGSRTKKKMDSGSEAGMTHVRRGPLALDLESLKAIRTHFQKLGRKPTDVELETFAQTWSEHCKHTIFASPIDEIKDGLFKHYIKRATEDIRSRKKELRIRKNGSGDFCVSVFKDNSGAITFDENFLVTHKMETHNTPSALDPFGGAITGIVGVNRDSLGFGLGAKPIANLYGFCVADPKDKTELYRDAEKKQKMLSAERIMQGVVAGINSGGNQSGIPTPLGFMYFDSRFRGKPLVFAGTVGLIPKMIGKRKSHEKKAEAGDYIVMVGGRVGKDGIHGATFSSEGLDPNSPATAVQIGDPITQKKFSDAIIHEVRDKNLYNSITDNGAGGLASSVGEMAKESGGCLVYLDKVPVKYPGLQPWEIWTSESQERMTLAVPKKSWARLSKILKSRDVEATVVGQFTNSKKCVVKYGKQTVMDVSLKFLHEGMPVKHLVTKRSVPNLLGRPKTQPINRHATLTHLVLNLFSELNICSTEFISNQYDHEVQATSVTKPLQGKGRVNSEAAVLRPVLNSSKGIVLSYGMNPHLSEIDPYTMAATSIDFAIGAAVASGANVDELALLDNFCWCSSWEPERLWQLKEAARACYDTALAYGTPFISGKDSMFNDFKGFSENGEPLKISIPPTLLISTIGVIPDVTKAITLDAKNEDDLIYVLGITNNELGGSEYSGMVGNDSLGVPNVNPKQNIKIFRALYQAGQKNLIASAISISRGGIAAALGKMCVGGKLGATIDLKNVPAHTKNIESILFSESSGRLLVTVDPYKQKEFEKLMAKNIFAKIGTIGGKQIIISDAKKTVAKVAVHQLEQKYKEPLINY